MKHDHDGYSSNGAELGFQRLIAFCDAVFSVAITLAVVQAMPPDLAKQLATEGSAPVLRRLVPQVLNVLMSFVIVALYWLAHHRLFTFIRKYDRRLIQLNLVFLISISFLPLSVQFLGADDSLAVVVYAANMALTGFLLTWIWSYSCSKGFTEPGVTETIWKLNLIRSLVPPTLFLLSIPLAFWNRDIARYFWLLMLFSRKIAEWLVAKPHRVVAKGG